MLPVHALGYVNSYVILGKILVSKTNSDSSGISSHDSSKSDTDSDYNPEPSTSSISSSFNRKAEL